MYAYSRSLSSMLGRTLSIGYEPGIPTFWNGAWGCATMTPNIQMANSWREINGVPEKGCLRGSVPLFGGDLLLKLASQCDEQVTNRELALQGVPHGQTRVNRIAIASADAATGEIAVSLEVSNYLLYGPLGDADFVRQPLGCADWMPCYEGQHMPMIGEECPLTSFQPAQPRLAESLTVFGLSSTIIYEPEFVFRILSLVQGWGQ